MRKHFVAGMMVVALGGCETSLAQPHIPPSSAHKLRHSPAGMVAIGTTSQMSPPLPPCTQSGTVHVIRLLIEPDSLMASAKNPCENCIRSLTVVVAPSGVLSNYTTDKQQSPPQTAAVADWPTPFDFDIKPDAIPGQPTLVQIMLRDPHLDFYFPYSSQSQVNLLNNATEAAYVDTDSRQSHDIDSAHFSCASISMVTDNVNKVAGKTLQFFIDPGLVGNIPLVPPPSVNIDVIWESPTHQPKTFLPIAIDPHPTNNG